jgi:phage gp45-like
MSSKSKEQLELKTEEVEDETTSEPDRRELYLREGRTLVLEEKGTDDLVEIRSASGELELRIKLTADGPVLQMESVKLQLKASESVEIASKRVEIKATESVQVASENEVKVDAEGDVRVNGKMIYLN